MYLRQEKTRHLPLNCSVLPTLSHFCGKSHAKFIQVCFLYVLGCNLLIPCSLPDVRMLLFNHNFSLSKLIIDWKFAKNYDTFFSSWRFFLKTRFTSALIIVVNLLLFSSFHCCFVYFCIFSKPVYVVLLPWKKKKIMSDMYFLIMWSDLNPIKCKIKLMPAFLLTQKKVAKVVYFLETALYETSRFWMNMMVCTNLVVNSVLFCFRSKPGRPCYFFGRLHSTSI